MLDFKEEYKALCQQVITSLRAGSTKEAANYQIYLEALMEAETRSLDEQGDFLEMQACGAKANNEPLVWTY